MLFQLKLSDLSEGQLLFSIGYNCYLCSLMMIFSVELPMLVSVGSMVSFSSYERDLLFYQGRYCTLRFYYLDFMRNYIYCLIHVCVQARISMGRYEPWSPQKRIIFLRPSKRECNLQVWDALMSSSLVPARKMMLLSLFLLIRSMVSRSLMLISAFLLISPSRMQKKQENMQEKMDLHPLGACDSIFSLHNLFRLENGESATTILHLELRSRLTDPILLPQPTTTCPFSIKYSAATSTSLASSFPNEINSLCSRFPHPSKSKQASPTLGGRLSTSMNPQSLLEELPCKQRRRQSISLGSQTDRGKGIQYTEYLYLFPYSRKGSSRSSLYNTRGGRISIQLSCSRHVEGVQVLIWQLSISRVYCWPLPSLI